MVTIDDKSPRLVFIRLSPLAAEPPLTVHQELVKDSVVFRSRANHASVQGFGHELTESQVDHLGWRTGSGESRTRPPNLARRFMGIAFAIGLAVIVSPADTTNAAVSSIGPVPMIVPASGFGPAHPTGCDPSTTSSLRLIGTNPFERPGGPIVNTSHAKVSGLDGVDAGLLSLIGDITLGGQAATGTIAAPAFEGDVIGATGSFDVSSGSVFVSGTFVGSSPTGVGSCYGWDRGDSDPATSAAHVGIDLTVSYVGQRIDADGTRAIGGIVTITTSRSCALLTASTGVCGSAVSLVFAPGAGPTCVPVPPDAIGWWPGEVDFAAAIGPDLTGLSAFSPGKVGFGFALGSVELLSAPSLAVVNDGLTLEAWVSPALSSGLSQTIMSRWDFPSIDDSARSYWLRIDPIPATRIVFETDESSTRRPEVLTADAPGLLDFNPHHVAATWSPTSIDIYLDGTLLASKLSQGGRLNDAATTDFRIGSQTRGFGYAGMIDEPTVYSRALSAGEIAAIAAAGAGGKCDFITVDAATAVIGSAPPPVPVPSGDNGAAAPPTTAAAVPPKPVAPAPKPVAPAPTSVAPVPPPRSAMDPNQGPYDSRYTQAFGYYPDFHTRTNTLAKVQEFNAALGGPPDLFMVSATGNTAHEYGSAVWGQFEDPTNGYLPSMAGQVNVEVLVPMNPTGGGSARARTAAGLAEIRTELLAVAAGRDDAVHRQQAERIVAAGFPRAILRIGSEMDSVDWADAAYRGGNHEAYIAAFRHIVGIYRSVSPQFEFSWTILSHVWAPSFPSHVFLGYPGDDWVDYWGMDIYYHGSGPPDDATLDRYRARLEEHAARAAARGKRVAYPEWAQTGHDDPRYFDFMVAWHAELGDQLGYANYFASGGGESGRDYGPRSYPTLWKRLVEHYAAPR